MYTLIVEQVGKKWHNHFTTMESLLFEVDRISIECNDKCGYPSFSDGAINRPFPEETVMTILDGDRVLHPKSAGGQWTGYDNRHNRTKIE
jgi:hypothetical protein